MSRNAIVFLLLAVGLAIGKDDEAAAARKSAQLAKRAKRHEKSGKELWKQFVLADHIETKEVKKLVTTYEKAIDLYQQALETHEEPGLNAVILTLTRRVTQARFELMRREMQKRRPKPKPKPKPEPKPEESAPKEPEPEPEPEEPVREKLPDGPLPDMEEPPAQRRRGTQGVRNFLMNRYFAPRKFASMVHRCSRCNGAGAVLTGRLTPGRKAERIPCGGCNRAGYHLNVPNARKGHWLIHSPLYRSTRSKSEEWSGTLAEWRKDPRKVPEYLTKVKIVEVDYHGLWAEIYWTEQGTTPDRRRFVRERKEKVIRAGRRWFFYDETLDQNFFSGKTD